MKATSSKSENKKRKRDESQDAISESPKKAKVHAQRKFAQGAAFNSPVITPIKDKVRPPSSVPASGPMLTSKCPNTEDFLTFLCFRRTSILPAKLDFFKDGFGSEPELSSSVANHKNNSEQCGRQSIKRGDKSEESKKCQTQTVQALRKKYQEQRLAKQKVSNVTKLAQKVKGKNMVRTRSSGVVEDSEKEVQGREEKSSPSGLRSGLKRVLPPANKTKKKVAKGKHLRSGLRSSGVSVKETSEKGNQPAKPAASSAKKGEKNKKKGKAEVAEVKGKSVKLKRAEGFSDFSSDDNEPLLAVKKPKTGGKTPEKVGVSVVGRGERSVKTRSQISELESSRGSMRPTRKTKEAAAIYMEMITKKLVSPEKSGDEDVSSVDSFPELPNAKRNEQRETEIKAKAFAYKKVEPKPQAEAAGKETKKVVKKTDPTPKSDVKNTEEGEACKKANQKKEVKSKPEEGPSSVRKGVVRRSLKEEPAKGKQKEEEKKEAEMIQPSRPSTRSRHQEDTELAAKKPVARVSVPKTPKLVVKEEDKEKDKTAQSEKKPKAAKNLNAVSKNKGEGDGGSESKKGGKKTSEKLEVKEEKENSGKRDKKSAAEKEAERKKGKLKERVGDKKRGRKEGKEGPEEGNPVSKRPTRKCSTADKIWIDIDGFTSDEEDFVDVAQVTKTRASAKKAKDASGNKPEEKIGGGNKLKSDKTKDADKEKDTSETRKSKPENKNADNEGKTKENVARKNEAAKTCGNKPAAKVERKAKERTEPKSTSKTTAGGTDRPSGRKEAEKQKVVPEAEKEQKRQEDSGKKTEASVAEEASTEPNSESKKEKKGEGTGKKDEGDTGASAKEEEGEDESSGGRRRKRPVRQCSTGEKKWIETDSDSFSFYESSDDEDDLPIVDFGGKNPTPATPTETKESKTAKESDKDKTVTEKKSEDCFSESDEEPLKKKALLLEEEVSKLTEPKSESLAEPGETRGVGKTQREIPGLHPLKKIPGEATARTCGVEVLPPASPKLGVVRLPVAKTFVPTEPKILIHDSKNVEGKPEVPGFWGKEGQIPEPRGSFLMQRNESPVVSVPNRIEMILHTLKKEKMGEGNAGYSNNVKVTFGNVPYNPVPYPLQPRINQVPCTYQIKTVKFPPPREPISTHGLDLLSEVALPTTPKGKMSSPTERIEKWLNDSLAAEPKKRFPGFESSECKRGEGEEPGKAEGEKTQSELGCYYGNPGSSPAKESQSSHAEIQKFGQVELLESQKLLKKNLFSAEPKQEGTRVGDQQAATPKKALTSVQDLLKLQKERKDVAKASADNSPHLKNCKCNNCIVKKGWFKNKPVPKMDQLKSSAAEDCEESAKPFESLTKAFNKISGEGKNSKMSVSVAPMVVSPPPPPLKSSQDAGVPSAAREGTERKGMFYQRKLSFLERMKERERKEAAAVKPSPNAFSPNNESSVYAFEPEPEQLPSVNAPFRSKTRESRTSSASKSDDEGLKTCEDEPSTVAAASRPQTEKAACASKASQSASIAVQVNLDSETPSEVESTPEVQDGKSIEISTQTEVPEEDSDSPMFYIPLQQARAASVSDSSEQQLIQGVALKLGTEGPMGPNQRVIMKAKLVTKPPDTPSIKAVVMPQPKRMFDQKNNNPPIGTVQPTTRKPPEIPAEGQNASKSSEANLLPPAKPSPPSGKSDAPLEKSSPAEPEAFASKTTKTSVGTPHGKPSGKSKEKTPQPGNREKPEATDEHSPCSSASSSSKSRRTTTKQKNSEFTMTPSSSAWLAPGGTPSKLVEAPTFHPTEKDFQDPFEFFDRIRPAAEKFGLCRIVPPSNFKPDCKVSDDMRFTAYNQYVHRMFHRWGPNVKEMMAIKKYLTTQSISLKQPPWIGGMEVDLPRLYQSVQNCGGLMKVMEKKKWNQVADAMKIPKAAQDRVTKLDDIYCKYLLPYDTLSHDERQKLFDEVDRDWTERQENPGESQNEEEAEEENYIEECEECVVKGRNMALNQFYRIARNTMSMWFRSPEPSPREVENEYWRHVRERNHHVCVHSGSIDSSGWGYGFPVAKNNSFSKHPWNLKVLTNNCGSVLRSLGPVMGVTVPTLHVGMVFAAFCWYRDPHGLPWIEYLHTGAPKIWYGISDDNSTVFQEALAKLLPRYIKNKTVWLPSDTAMIPPDLLVEHGVSLCHTVQEPGQFILVFPRAFTSSICTGYLVSESVYFAQPSWLANAEQVFKDIQESCEPSMFSLEKLLFSIATDSRSSVEVLKQVLPMVWHVRQKELDSRKTLCNLGLKSSERLPSRELGSKKKKGRWAREDDGDYECEICRMNLYVSLVINSHEEGVYCLPHAIDLLTQKRHHLKYCKLMYTYTQEEMNEMVEKLEQKIENKSQKKSQGKSSSTAK